MKDSAKEILNVALIKGNTYEHIEHGPVIFLRYTDRIDPEAKKLDPKTKKRIRGVCFKIADETELQSSIYMFKKAIHQGKVKTAAPVDEVIPEEIVVKETPLPQNPIETPVKPTEEIVVEEIPLPQQEENPIEEIPTAPNPQPVHIPSPPKPQKSLLMQLGDFLFGK